MRNMVYLNAKTVTDCYEAHDINFVNFLTLVQWKTFRLFRGKVYEGNWQAKDVKQLQTRIKLCLKTIYLDLVFSLFGLTRLRVGRIRRFGQLTG